MTSDPADSWRIFDYSSFSAKLSLEDQGQAKVPDRKPAVLLAALISTVHRDSLSQRFQLLVTNWNQNTLPVQLPARATIHSIYIDGTRLDRLPSHEQDDYSHAIL